MANENREVRLRITGCTPVFQGRSGSVEYSLHEVTATKENGEAIEERLTSFEDLPVGEVLDLVVSPHNSEKHGKSYKLARRHRRSSSERLDKLERRVTDLTERLELIEQFLGPLNSSPAEDVQHEGAR